MLLKTHLAFAVLAIILLIQHVQNPVIFIAMVLIATTLPDADSAFSTAGRNIISKSLRLFVKHRGVIHSLTTGIIIAIALSIYWPIASLGFFIGWSVHILCDSFTKDGVQPFWPLKFTSNGVLRTGGRIEETLFITMIFADLFAFVLLIMW